MAEHTGQSSQLFTDANDRNAQFLATVARSALDLKAKPNKSWLSKHEGGEAIRSRRAHYAQITRKADLTPDKPAPRSQSIHIREALVYG